MKPTDILSNEHRVIEQVWECLGKIVERSKSDRKLAIWLGTRSDAIGIED